MNRAKILLASPEPRALQAALRDIDTAEALTAADAEQALDVARRERPQLVLVDDDLPPGGGAPFCLSLRADAQLAEVAILLLATGTHHREADLCRQHQCQKILFKPVSTTELLDTLRAYLALVPLMPRPARLTRRVEARFGRHGRLTHQGESVDLSLGGAFLETTAPYTTGTLLSLALTLPGTHQPLRCGTRVAWVNQPESSRKPRYPQGLGLQFLNLTPADQEILQTFLQQETPATFPAPGEKNLDNP